MGYKEDTSVDKHNLEEEWTKQSSLFLKWGEAHAEAITEKDRAKEKLDIIKSEIDSDIRTRPEKYGFDKKPTEAAISSIILKHPKYTEVNNEVIKCNEEVNVLAVAKEAMNHKKKALENLTTLWVAGYYSDPDIPKEAKEIVAEKKTKLIKEKLNKKRQRIK